MKRTVQPELLDALPPADPRAMRSRHDLRRVNAWMGNHNILVRALRSAKTNNAPCRITELGAGDGQLFLRVARKLAPLWPNAEVSLLDQREAIEPATLTEFERLGWRTKVIVCDIRDWIHQDVSAADIMFANLFLHHFADRELARLLRGIAAKTRFFAALEPRRAGWPLCCSRLLWVIGCNQITRYDAPVSVRAGFNLNELSALWPQSSEWELMETEAGAFSHLFVAQRKD